VQDASVEGIKKIIKETVNNGKQIDQSSNGNYFIGRGEDPFRIILFAISFLRKAQ
jgi:hypothetical protein